MYCLPTSTPPTSNSATIKARHSKVKIEMALSLKHVWECRDRLTVGVRVIGLGLIAGDFAEGRIEVAPGVSRLAYRLDNFIHY